MSIQLRVSFRRSDFDLDVDLEVPGQGVTALFGPSGCGKSTLLRAIAGLERFPGGRLQVGDQVWQDDDCFLPPHRRPIGMVFQEDGLFPHLDVKGNLEFGWKRVPPAERRISLPEAVAALRLEPLLERRVDRLSGGERQRVSIARALAVSPQLLLMDEPLSALDEASRRELLPLLESLQEQLQVPIFYVSHTMDEVARLADTLVLFAPGRVLAQGDVPTILTRLDLPLATTPDAGTVLEAEVIGFEEEFHLLKLQFAGGCLLVPNPPMELGRRMRVRVAARDVSLTLKPAEDSSIQNILPAKVEEVLETGASQVTVRLRMGETPWLARITRKSAVGLGLEPGVGVYAQVKSVVLL